MTDFPRLLQALSDGGVIGGLAATLHGSAHSTVDLDVVYRRSEENVARLAAAVAPLAPSLRGAPPGLPFRFDAPTIRMGMNFTLVTSAGSWTCSARPPAVERTTRCSRTANRASCLGCACSASTSRR
jgi:hypothetical protein